MGRGKTIAVLYAVTFFLIVGVFSGCGSAGNTIGAAGTTAESAAAPAEESAAESSISESDSAASSGQFDDRDYGVAITVHSEKNGPVTPGHDFFINGTITGNRELPEGTSIRVSLYNKVGEELRFAESSHKEWEVPFTRLPPPRSA